MPTLVFTAGWTLDALASIWMVLILIKLLAAWLVPARGEGQVLRFWMGRLVEVPVDIVRRTIPTVYRTVDFAPWLTLLLMVLVKTFILRAMIYWGMLHHSGLGG